MTEGFYPKYGKRCLDVASALFGIVGLSPLLILVAAAVRVTSKGPALFKQTRVGQFGQPFRIFKFRTMTVSSAAPDCLVTAAGDPRVTTLGKWLRKTKIDELPQLLNVLKGEMTLVGPRPEVPRYTDTYSDDQKRVFTAKPGITGPSIIMDEEELMRGQEDKEGFYISTILPAKLQIDVAYSSDIQFSNDLRVLKATIARLLLRVFGISRPQTNPGECHLAATGVRVEQKDSVLQDGIKQQHG
jgi:lipopolysaccharide/colanic/teichoic acid biosynthesis glycosyltransferase